MKINKAFKYFNRRLGLNKFFPDNNENNLVAIFDTSIGSLNVGDEIINKSATVFLEDIFHDKQITRLATHTGMGSIGLYIANTAKHRVVCGSNLISGGMFRSGQWNLSLLDVLRIKQHILLGVGWQTYDSEYSWTTKLAYKMLLSKDGYHSVRDEFTKKKLEEIGFRNVINTGCPTIWKLTKEHCSLIPTEKAKNVVTTLTARRQDPRLDKCMLDTLVDSYEHVYLWLQGLGDNDYFESLGDYDNITLIPPHLSAYDKVLKENESLDFVGTRLHAGIRALQYKRRTLVVAVDNRATEKSKDFNLEIIQRSDLDTNLYEHINSKFETKIKLDQDSIYKWMSQFK
ncbi:polysaccharide pyruvyl transferase family protein [Vibrio gallicus]|uniref:polysaccharide pyruvyl transferase family protein n=1 Tax=Vibrio gallicus TaxID=190897 RepID=UPI0021C2D3FB|nr:polysaccharide pyruvyl transferase family protein [Vibrio gallicus]